MNKENWNLEWYWDGALSILTIHVFPHRTFLIKTNVNDNNIIPYLAGLCCFNVILGQNDSMNVIVDSINPLPEGLKHLSDFLKIISSGKFIIEFNNLTSNFKLKESFNKVLLFSGGKDSLWQLNHLSQNKITNNLIISYVTGTTIAGEYIQELATVKKLSEGMDIHTVSVESFDYTSIGLNFRYRPRWRMLMLVALARMFSDEIWTGISVDERYTTENGLSPTDKLDYFSETPHALKKLAEMLNCNIWLAPSESYCFFNIDAQNFEYRSCFSPDILCNPIDNFENSCGKCRTLHIYRKIGNSIVLTKDERLFFDGDEWMGDNFEDIIKHAKNRFKITKPTVIIGKY